MRVLPDTHKCIGAGTCVGIAPDVFDQDDDGTVVVLREHLEPDRRGALEEAVEFCPAQALTLTESD